MERLISVLRGEVKREIESIGTYSMFYATAPKTLKREYGNPLVVSHLKLKNLFDQPQIKNQDRTALREYQHQLKCSNTWCLSMDYYDAISSTENLARAVKRLPNYLRQKFYESTRDYDPENVVTLIEFEKWLQIRINHLFNPSANIIASQETKLKDVPPHARSSHGKILESEVNKLTCWLCNDKHKLHQCEMFKSKSLPEKKVIVEKERFCWNCLAEGHQIKECKSNVKCRITNCGKRHHTLLHEIKPPNPPKDDVTTNNLKANIDPKVYFTSKSK